MSEKLNIVKRVSISPGNQKMGLIPSVSLPAVVTCRKDAPCFSKCYARRMTRYTNVKNAYDRNYELLLADPDEYWKQVKNAAEMTRYFRFHVSGDIPSAGYFRDMIRTAEGCPKTKFLCFTKRWDITDEVITERKRQHRRGVPCNLKLIYSCWKDFAPTNPHGLPTAAVIFDGETPYDNWKVCGGNCAECACRGCGCWELKNGETIAFYEH